MRKLMIAGVAVLVMVLALAADAPPAGPGGDIYVQGAASTLGGTLQQPEIIASADSITVEGADGTFRDPLQERSPDTPD